MTPFVDYEAVDAKTNLRVAMYGPSGSGKTYSALILAKYIAEVEGTKVVVIDTENASSNRYARAFEGFSFRVVDFEPPYTIAGLIEALDYCNGKGYSPIVIDSFSHFYAGEGGALDAVSAASSRFGGNERYAWRDITPQYNRLISKIYNGGHVIATMRSKDDIVEKDESGRKKYLKTGVKPVSRPGTEYEFDIVITVNLNHEAIVEKTRYFKLDGLVGVIDDRMAKLIYEAYTSQNSAEKLVSKEEFMKQAEELGFSKDQLAEFFKVNGWGKYNPAMYPIYMEALVVKDGGKKG